MKTYPRAPLVAAALIAASAATTEKLVGEEFRSPKVEVLPIHGVPTFHVNGEPYTLPCFETYVPTERYFRQFAEAGVELFSFNTNVSACDYGHSPPTRPGPDEWDYSHFDERASRVLAANPNAMLIPRINLGTPSWWMEENLSEAEVLHDGSRHYREPNANATVPKGRAFPSIVSRKWRESQAAALRRFLDHVDNSEFGPHIFGYLIAGMDTEEWYHWSCSSEQLAGYSSHTRQAFRDWLRGRYGDVDALRAAWRDPAVTFSSADVPSKEARVGQSGSRFRDPATDMPVIDFYIFYNEVIPETIDYFAGVIRERVGPNKALGAFYGYMYEFRGDPEYGHNALERYNESKNLDFIFVTASYTNREFGTGGDYSRAPGHSVRLHGKLWYHDNDVVSFLAPEVYGRKLQRDEKGWKSSVERQLQVLGYTTTPEHTKWMYRRSMGFSICNGAYTSYFDLHGGYYDNPELLAEVERLNRVARSSAGRDRSSVSEILVVADEDSNAYCSFRNPSLASSMLDSPIMFLKVGAPQDHILLCDLDRVDVSRYKLVVFLNCYNVTDGERIAIERRLKADGRTLAWCYAPGYFNRNERGEDLMRDLTGIHVAATAHEAPTPRPLARAASESGLAGAIAGVVGQEPPAVGDAGDDSPFYVADHEATALAHDAATGLVTLAEKTMPGWRSIYASSPIMPPGVWREIARSAGVHIYNDSADTLYVNKSYLCVHADGPGVRTLRLPARHDVRSAIGPERVWRSVDAMDIELQNGETVLLELSPVDGGGQP
ncbi:hypothetical protein [Botrimarina sp.]|uniref:hypothetical protein n=1 Tax=Botrimarina sp. TaxID=2795802 RepID=UPI0032EAAB42